MHPRALEAWLRDGKETIVAERARRDGEPFFVYVLTEAEQYSLCTVSMEGGPPTRLPIHRHDQSRWRYVPHLRNVITSRYIVIQVGAVGLDVPVGLLCSVLALLILLVAALGPAAGSTWSTP
jgi:hypothetical protein